MNINFNLIIKSLIPLFIITLIAYGLNSILYLYLPSIQYNSASVDNNNFEYKKYQVEKSLKQKSKIIKVKKKKVKKKEYKLISSILLKGIYSTANNQGWIIISEKSSSKTHMLSINESFKDYVLKLVHPKYVIFTKGDKEYKLSLIDENTKQKYTISKTQRDNK